MSRPIAAAAQPALSAPSFPTLARVLHLISTARAVRHQRLALAGLDATRLADLGLSANEAEAEAQRPFWDAPRGWR